MFDIGFWELVIISIVALLVVGPDKMPGLVRDIGRWVRATKRFIMQTRYDIEQELNLDQEKKLMENIKNIDHLMDIAPDREQKKDSASNNK